VNDLLAQVVIVETASATIAKTTSNLMPIVVFAIVASWTGLYARWQQARSERRV
jgi:hypothetical protein